MMSLTAVGSKDEAGIWLPGKGLPLTGSMMGLEIAEKSPLRWAAVGTTAELIDALTRRDSGALTVLIDALDEAADPADLISGLLRPLIQERSVRESRAVEAQLQVALSSRVVIEQAKGMLAERGQITVDAAFARLRDHARGHNLKISDVARDLVDGRLDPAPLLSRGD